MIVRVAERGINLQRATWDRCGCGDWMADGRWPMTLTAVNSVRLFGPQPATAAVTDILILIIRTGYKATFSVSGEHVVPPWPTLLSLDAP